MTYSTRRKNELIAVYWAIVEDDKYWLDGPAHKKAVRLAGKIATIVLPVKNSL